jgi:nitrate reductase delta subunit
MQVLKALSALLCYPEAPLREAVGEICLLLSADPALDEASITALGPLTKALATEDLFDLQAAYVDLFDRGRRLSLHLFEHVHGESRDRGQAMVDLAQVYERGGLLLADGELPDYLPTFLEFASTRPDGEALSLLGEIAPILTSMHAGTAARAPDYAAVFAALLHIAGHKAAAVPLAEPVEDFAALDAAWEETTVQFGPGEDIQGCGPDRLRQRLRAAGRDARVAV